MARAANRDASMRCTTSTPSAITRPLPLGRSGLRSTLLRSRKSSSLGSSRSATSITAADRPLSGPFLRGIPRPAPGGRRPDVRCARRSPVRTAKRSPASSTAGGRAHVWLTRRASSGPPWQASTTPTAAEEKPGNRDAGTAIGEPDGLLPGTDHWPAGRRRLSQGKEYLACLGKTAETLGHFLVRSLSATLSAWHRNRPPCRPYYSSHGRSSW